MSGQRGMEWVKMVGLVIKPSGCFIGLVVFGAGRSNALQVGGAGEK